jgi:hypothetical protein
MIKDAQGRKWFMRFKRYSNGWHWEARVEERHGGIGREASKVFRTKAHAEADAHREITTCDAVALSREYFRRWRARGTECQMTHEDHEAITRAGYGRRRRAR